MVSQGGETIFSEAAGYIDITATQEVDENSIYAIASMTKPIVSTAILQLIERGQLDLETKLKDIFPQFAFMMVAPKGDMSAAFEPAKEDITIRHLLTHTAGSLTPRPFLELVMWPTFMMSSACSFCPLKGVHRNHQPGSPRRASRRIVQLLNGSRHSWRGHREGNGPKTVSVH